MAIQAQEEFKGVSLPEAYLKVNIIVDVEVYKDQAYRDQGISLGSKRLEISDNLHTDTYKRVIEEYYPNATDLL